jgi:hypothetical protein
MKLLDALHETPIGRALTAFFVDLPHWVLFNVIFAAALAPVLFAALRGEFMLALVLSFPPALVMAGLIRHLSMVAENSALRWSSLWVNGRGYRAVLSVWVAIVAAGLMLLTPLLYVAVIPAVIVLLLAPLALCSSERLHVSTLQTWRNAFIMAVHYPVVALGLVLLAALSVWCVLLTQGALIIVLPALWAAISVYTVDDVIRSLRAKENTP